MRNDTLTNTSNQDLFEVAETASNELLRRAVKFAPRYFAVEGQKEEFDTFYHSYVDYQMPDFVFICGDVHNPTLLRMPFSVLGSIRYPELVEEDE